LSKRILAPPIFPGLPIDYYSTWIRDLRYDLISSYRAFNGINFYEISPEECWIWDRNTSSPLGVGAREGYYKGDITYVRSKQIFPYGKYVFELKLPLIPSTHFHRLYIGSMGPGESIGGMVAFRLSSNATLRTDIFAQSALAKGSALFDASGLTNVPNPTTQFLRYMIKVNRASAEYWVYNGVGTYLLGIVQMVAEADEYTVKSTDPYLLVQKSTVMPTHGPLTIILLCKDSAMVNHGSNVYVSLACAGDGDPAPPRTLHLYTEGSRWEGRSVNTSITSDGIPVTGYKHKTVYFMADGAGTLDISVDYGDNAYDLLTSLAVTADALLVYTTENDILWLKLKYTPSSPPKTITRARVMMSD